MPMPEQRDVSHPAFRLSPMQTSCLRWSAEGRTLKEVAQIEGISVSTVADHLSNVRQMLGAPAIAKAIAIATRLQLI